MNSEPIRLDVILARRGLASSRAEAQRLVESGSVAVDGQIVRRVNHRVAEESDVVVSALAPRFVGRGGEKLAAALLAFELFVDGAECLDIGISTGGFTDCLLQAGAAHVVGIDVGHGQLHNRLVDDARVELREGVNARYIDATNFGKMFDLIVIDVSFISLTLILPAAKKLLSPSGQIVCLIKPQFEVGAGCLGKNGIVTDGTLREAARQSVNSFASSLHLNVSGTIESPITGGDGNIEYLSLFTQL
jgi:23S rRNA (cytidine1920-2'-O)/16S rRNA (cytidine1409-2'-O)-methyltransferase